MAVTTVFFDTAAAPGSKLDPEMRAEIEFLAPGLEDGEVGNSQLADNSITTDKIAPGGVTGVDIAADTLVTENYGPGSVDTAALADDAVTAAKAGVGVKTAYDAAGNPIESKEVYLTSAQYNLITTPDPNTTYYIT